MFQTETKTPENGSKVSLSKGETEEEAPEAEDSVPEEEKTE